MAEKISELIEALQQTNVQFRRQLELAEAQIPKLNDSLGQLTNLGFGVSCVVLGEIILSANYGAEGPDDSGQLYQAAIVVPGAIGIILWDALVYEECSRHQDGLEIEARTHIVPFDRCSPGIKSLLFRCVEPLVNCLLQAIGLTHSALFADKPQS